jgi:hypothetical protein
MITGGATANEFFLDLFVSTMGTDQPVLNDDDGGSEWEAGAIGIIVALTGSPS